MSKNLSFETKKTRRNAPPVPDFHIDPCIARAAVYCCAGDRPLVQRVVFHSGEGFFFDSASSKTFLPFISWTTAIFINGAILLLVVNWLRERRVAKHLLLDNRKIIFLLLTLALGPGLLVNGFLKSHWGRARPSEVSTFGGRQSFSPAYVIAHQCRHNCSFVSGDALRFERHEDGDGGQFYSERAGRHAEVQHQRWRTDTTRWHVEGHQDI